MQYGHARIASVFKNAEAADIEAARTAPLDPLTNPAEITLARRLAECLASCKTWPEHLAPHRLTRYARDIASDFHQFYHDVACSWTMETCA